MPSRLRPVVVIGAGGIVRDAHLPAYRMAGFPNINDNVEIVDLISCGAHLIVFATGRGSVAGSVVSPVIKVCGNPETYRSLSEDMDVNAGAVLEGETTIEGVGEQAHEVRRAGAPGVHDDLQELRAAGPIVPAGRLSLTRTTP